MSQPTRVIDAATTPDGVVTALVIGDTPVALTRSEGRLYAFRDLCSHAECPLSPGEVAEGQIECQCHGARFDLATGQPTAPPATRPIVTFPVEEDGRDALVAVTP